MIAWASARSPQLARKKEIPIHRHSIWYYFGGMTLFLFSVQVVTGILLLLYYRPSAETAFESVQFIITEVQFGWLIRSVHSWSANLMIATLFIHMFSVYFMRAYRRPREITWLSGVLLLLLAVGVRVQRISASVEQAGFLCHQRSGPRSRESFRWSAGRCSDFCAAETTLPARR